MKDPLGHGSDAGAHAAGTQKTPQLQRRHFEAIAADLAAKRPRNNLANSNTSDTALKSALDAHDKLVSDTADKLATTNPGFRRDLFVKAATGGDYRFKGPGNNEAAVARKVAFAAGAGERAARADAAGSSNYRGSGTGPGGIGERKLTTRKLPRR